MKSSNGVPALVGTSNGALRWIRLRLPAWCRPNEENRRPPAQNIYCIGGNIKKKIETGVVRRSSSSSLDPDYIGTQVDCRRSKSRPANERKRTVAAERGRYGTPARSSKRTSIRSANKHHIQISTTPARSINRTSVSSANKQQSQISFISTSKERTKHTISSTIRRKRQITTHDNDNYDNDGGDIYGGGSASWGTASIQHTQRYQRSRR